MGFLDTLLGNDAAKASKAAAADTYGKQQAASAGLQGAGNDYQTALQGLSKNYAPWQATGQTANDAVARLIADPSSVRSLPAYQFLLGEGTKAIDRGGAATGNLFSGKTGKALEGYGVNLADKTYGDQLARLMGVSQQGLQATGLGTNTAGEGYRGQLGARTSAYNQDFNSAGTIGQGDVAAANAQAKGLQGLLNFGGSLVGMGLGGGGGFGNTLMKGAGDTVGGWLAPKGGFTGWTG